MRRSRCTKPTRLIAGLLTGLLLAIMAVPLIAQPVGEPYYDVHKEVTLNGTVATVLQKAAHGMTWGSHLFMETTTGRVDASLGVYGLEGKGAPSIAPGQQIEVTGVMKTLNKREVLVVRTVNVNGKVYTLRNDHGFELTPRMREHAAEKGESR